MLKNSRNRTAWRDENFLDLDFADDLAIQTSLLKILDIMQQSRITNEEIFRKANTNSLSNCIKVKRM